MLADCRLRCSPKNDVVDRDHPLGIASFADDRQSSQPERGHRVQGGVHIVFRPARMDAPRHHLGHSCLGGSRTLQMASARSLSVSIPATRPDSRTTKVPQPVSFMRRLGGQIHLGACRSAQAGS
jgi:hypothetical protein